MNVTIQGTSFTLLPEKALFDHTDKILILADLHLGKAMHFRRSGIAMPAAGVEKDFEVLNSLIERYNPLQVWFLGDLFHSDYNSEWLLFESFVRQHSGISFTLIRGNHDILKLHHYESLGVQVTDDYLVKDQIIFSHAPLADVPEGLFNIAGHVHPGIILRGIAHQQAKLPCFFIEGSLMLLPAFGRLTGLYTLEMNRNSTVFAILKAKILKL